MKSKKKQKTESKILRQALNIVDKADVRRGIINFVDSIAGKYDACFIVGRNYNNADMSMYWDNMSYRDIHQTLEGCKFEINKKMMLEALEE